MREIILITVLGVIGAIIFWFAKKSKKTYLNQEKMLLSDIEKAEGFDISLLNQLSIAIIRQYSEKIIKSNQEVLNDYLSDEASSEEEILELIDLELDEIESLENQAKKDLVYELFLTSCSFFDLKVWTPVVSILALRLGQEGSDLRNVNNTYNFFVDLVALNWDFIETEFSGNCLATLEDSGIPETRIKEVKEILDDFVFVVMEEIKQKKAV